jgi:hypothetical protein
MQYAAVLEQNAKQSTLIVRIVLNSQLVMTSDIYFLNELT